MRVGFGRDETWISLLQSFVISASYVGSLYIFKSTKARDHPDTVKQRFKSVFCVCACAPFFLYACSNDTPPKHDLWSWMGVFPTDFLASFSCALLLTFTLFAGPLLQLILDEGVEVLLGRIFSFNYLYSWNWHRIVIIAPFTEEFVFRSCLIPILSKSFTATTAVFVAPLFFGVAHLHHIAEQIAVGTPATEAVLVSLFQMLYTTVFGIYSSFVYVRTCNLAAIVVCHSFCNIIGFPDFAGAYESKHRVLLCCTYVAGLLFFILRLFPLTEFTSSTIF